MATQNFLSGGYYGKLGDTVGQRWKNKRIIRQYVIPNDPKTPAQQANRKLFGSYVPYAQLGMSANYRSPAFDLEFNTEWAYRMKAVSELHKEGKTDLALIPLYPINFEVPSVIDAIAINGLKENEQISFLLSGNVPSTARDYSIFLYFADGTREGEILLLSGETSAENPNQLICEIENTAEIEDAEIYCRICTRDDTTADTIAASSRLLAEKQLRRQFATELTLHNASTDENGVITLIYTTENEFSQNTEGTFNFAVTSASGTANLKDGTSQTVKKADFTTNFEAIDINNEFSFKITLTPAFSASNAKNLTASLNLTANFANFHTEKTKAATATEQISYNTQWQNSQPQASIITQTAITSTDANGILTAYIQTLAPYEEAIAPNFSQSVSYIAISGTFKDGTTLNPTNLTFTTNFAVLNHNGYFRLQYTLTPNHTPADMKNYETIVEFNFSIQNYYTAETMPADITKYSSAKVNWTNSQPAYSTNITVKSATSNNDGSCTVIFESSSALPINYAQIDISNILVLGNVKTKEAVDAAENESTATTTAANKFTWKTYDLAFAPESKTFSCKIKSTNGCTQINNYYINANFGIQLENAYTAETMPAQLAKMPAYSSFPVYWQKQMTLNNITLSKIEGLDDDAPYAKYWICDISGDGNSWADATNNYCEWNAEPSADGDIITVKTGGSSCLCSPTEAIVTIESTWTNTVTSDFSSDDEELTQGNCSITVPNGFYYTLAVKNAYNNNCRCTSGSVRITLPPSFTITFLYKIIDKTQKRQ